jgi:hypothetical protein
MKKLLAIAAILTLGFSVYSYAHGYGYGMRGGYGPGYGTGYGMMGPGYGSGYGPGYGMGPCYYRGYDDRDEYKENYREPLKQYSKEEAKAEFEKYISENFKGYKISSIDTFEMPRGTVYVAKVTDNAGNKLQFRLNPFGTIVGPFLDK